jgi:hypothetical protein
MVGGDPARGNRCRIRLTGLAARSALSACREPARELSRERHGSGTGGPLYLHCISHVSHCLRTRLVEFRLPTTSFTWYRCTISGRVVCILTQCSPSDGTRGTGHRLSTHNGRKCIIN